MSFARGRAHRIRPFSTRTQATVSIIRADPTGIWCADEDAAGRRRGHGTGRGLYGRPSRTGAPAHHPTAAAPLTRTQACRQLLDDVTRHQGRSQVPGLRLIADHVTDARMAGDARTAVRDIDHTGGAPVALALLRDDCAHAGMRIPAP